MLYRRDWHNIVYHCIYHASIKGEKIIRKSTGFGKRNQRGRIGFRQVRKWSGANEWRVVRNVRVGALWRSWDEELGPSTERRAGATELAVVRRESA